MVAYILSKRNRSVTATDLRKHLRTRLPEYMIPQHFVDIDEIPLTPAGKIDRRGMPAPDGTVRRAEDRFVAPRSKTERLLAELWQEIIGVERVSVHDNFFEMGGHSLLSMRLIARIAQETGLKVSPRAILLNTLEQTAAQMDESISLNSDKAAQTGSNHSHKLLRRL